MVAPSYWSRGVLFTWAIIPLNTALFFAAMTQKGTGQLFLVCTALCALQFFAGLATSGNGLRLIFIARSQHHSAGPGVARVVLGLLGGLGGILGWVGGVGLMGLGRVS